MNLQSSRRVFAVMLAAVFAMATALVVLLAYLVAELYLANKGWLIALPDGRELAHVRMRNLLLVAGVPAMAVLGFIVGWLNHVAPTPSALGERAPDDRRPGDRRND
jgi:hypothetical protein